MNFSIVILAAGKGRRMNSAMPKVLHPIAGRPLITYVIAAARQSGASHISAVVGDGDDQVKQAITDDLENVFFQKNRLGTAHALLAARDFLTLHDHPVIVLYGDTPLISAKTIRRIYRALTDGGNSIAVLGFVSENPGSYGRLITQGDKLLAIREAKEASVDELNIDLCNSGIIGFAGGLLPQLVEEIPKSASGEYYLTSVVKIAKREKLAITLLRGDQAEVMGVNTKGELAAIEAIVQRQLRDRALANGVTMIAPETVFLTSDTKLDRDVIIEPYVTFGPGVSVEHGAIIKSFCHLEGARIGSGAVIGPFARLRPGTDIGINTRIGNFCEIKQAKIAGEVKIGHLSYIGDAEVATKTNIGAGVVFCNYDGVTKHKTTIGSNAFVGSNSSLVAPVEVGEYGYIASGSIITEDVPTNSLALARARQVVKPRTELSRTKKAT